MASGFGEGDEYYNENNRNELCHKPVLHQRIGSFCTLGTTAAHLMKAKCQNNGNDSARYGGECESGWSEHGMSSREWSYA
jgi:hypothetical protein